MLNKTNQIIATKICELCDMKIYIINEKHKRVNRSTFNKNKELPHDCDGGAEKVCNITEANRQYWNRYYSSENFDHWTGISDI
jgi:hypothetical protein